MNAKLNTERHQMNTKLNTKNKQSYTVSGLIAVIIVLSITAVYYEGGASPSGMVIQKPQLNAKTAVETAVENFQNTQEAEKNRQIAEIAKEMVETDMMPIVEDKIRQSETRTVSYIDSSARQLSSSLSSSITEQINNHIRTSQPQQPAQASRMACITVRAGNSDVGKTASTICSQAGKGCVAAVRMEYFNIFSGQDCNAQSFVSGSTITTPIGCDSVLKGAEQCTRVSDNRFRKVMDAGGIAVCCKIL